jgi:hypothetical protein
VCHTSESFLAPLPITETPDICLQTTPVTNIKGSSV